MMKLAVRVVNALPRVLNKAAVPAFEIAASLAGTTVPSRPVVTNPVSGFGVNVGPGPPPRNCVVAGAEGRMAREKEIYLGLSERWRNIPKPTIAAVQGKCIAGGLMLAWPPPTLRASHA